MLRFIQFFFRICLLQGISIHPMLRFIPINARSNGSDITFQYIPCYGLSIAEDACVQYFLSFQYIPCYGLSLILNVIQGRFCNFNTSHVTVYHNSITARQNCTYISIHPMLRFITITPVLFLKSPIFQYIPCYGLSNTIMELKDLVYAFQYIPCYGLSKLPGQVNLLVCISIHPMLRFI